MYLCSIINDNTTIHIVYTYVHSYTVLICIYVLVAVVLFLCIVKTCTVNGSLGGNDVRRVNDTDPSDSLAEVVLLNNRTPNTRLYPSIFSANTYILCNYHHKILIDMFIQFTT